MIVGWWKEMGRMIVRECTVVPSTKTGTEKELGPEVRYKMPSSVLDI